MQPDPGACCAPPGRYCGGHPLPLCGGQCLGRRFAIVVRTEHDARQELLEKGQRKAVLEYLRLCAKFWSYDRGQIARWTAEINAGKIPEFGANLIY